ncbi:MAG: hypothetical protein CMJ25_10505 [Phycisphaerae bacterium]|nr:hypothetical protein [Phycisphaerae bacterium]|tara:strand:+ start:10653 stop:11774 length:1122 start_codon:yes stop_codon:yes gene_type:complete
MLRTASKIFTVANEFIPKSKTVYETVNQHKYARFANASYYYKRQNFVKEFLNEMKETRGFVLDPELSNEEVSTFVNTSTQEIVVAYRGTSSIKDIGTDLMVLTSTERLSFRVRSSLKLMERVLRKYTGFKIVSTGHSLGSFLSRVVGNTFNSENHNFNPAESIHGSFIKQNEMTFNYRTHFDAVSILAKDSIRVQTKLGNESTIESVHRLNNFYNKRANRVVIDGEEMLQSEKSTKIYEHSAHLGTLIDVAVASYDIKQGVQNKQRPLEIADNITRDILPPSPLQLYEDSEDGQEIDRIIRNMVDEASFKHHDKSTIQMLIEDAEKYNEQRTTDTAYEPHSVDVSTGYREVMGQDMPPQIDRINPHRQNRFRE